MRPGATGAVEPSPFPTWPAPTGAAALTLLVGTALLLRSEATRGFLAAVVNGADLLFHEAGHPAFGLLGWRFLAILGGTLGQLAFPVVALVGFARRRQPASTAVALVWLGLNLVDIGRYAADAEDRVLPLLAADADGHDWWNMLGLLGIRSSCRAIGGTIGAAGWTLQLLAPAWAVGLWLRDRAAPHRAD